MVMHSRMMWAASAMAALLLVAESTPSLAQGAADRAPKPGCSTTEKGEPATPVETGPASGTKNMGATGWSGGGLGGSHNQTQNAGPTPGSPTVQPETATGLDPTKSLTQSAGQAPACKEG